MATVFLARDTRHDRLVAVKVLRPELMATLGPQRFLREIRVSAQLQHPHIVPIHDSGDADGHLWYAMPYIEGESLRKRLARERQLPLDDALRITTEVADALAYAHGHGIVHRDIKPENILLSGGQAMIADFGLARLTDGGDVEHLTGTGLALGTISYMSPEQSTGDSEVDGRSDIYSLGCVLFEMLAGEPPFTGRSAQVIIARRLSEPVPPIRTLRDVPERVEQVVLTALARSPADRFTGASEFARALREADAEWRAHPSSQSAPPHRVAPPLARGRRLALPLIAAAAAGVLLYRWTSHTTGGTLDSQRVAIAPFDAYDSGLLLWREGLMDILSANVDGAGPLRTVSPSAVVRRWRGRSDAESAESLGYAVGAGLAVVGRIVSAGPDSVRAVALVVDVGRRSTIGELEVRDLTSRLDRLGDSLSLGILRLLGESNGLGDQRLGSLGARSIAALKAYLQGEQYLRRARWDSAAVWYARATEADSGFVLAHSRLKIASAWEVHSDTMGDGHALYAGAHNVGLAPRDSLLIVADSLKASLGAEDSLTWRRTRRLFATLDEAARRYPSDPFVWFRIGEARYHLAPPLDYTSRDVLTAFDRAIALDSAFGPAYALHPVELALILGDAATARRYTVAYLRHTPRALADSAMIITDLLLGATRSGELPSGVRASSPDVLFRVGIMLDMWFDSAQTALDLARAMVAMPPGSLPSGELRMRLARILSVRGHLQAAARELLAAADLAGSPDGETLELFTELALTGSIPASVSRRTFARWSAASPRAAAFALPWYQAHGDTAALRSGAATADSSGRAGPTPRSRELARYGAEAARAYYALAAADSAEALARFLALPDSLCPDCYFDWRTRAKLLMRAGRLDEAHRDLTRVLTYAWTVPTYPSALVLLGELEERRGNFREAARSWHTALDAWSSGDSTVAPERRRAEEGLRRLGEAA